MFCPNCGKEIPNGMRFCTNCGNDLSAVQREEQPAQPIQPVLVPQPPQAAGIQQPTINPAQPTSAKPKRGRLWLILIPVILLVCAAVAGVLLWLNLGKETARGHKVVSDGTAQGMQYNLYEDDTAAITKVEDKEAVSIVIPEKLDGYSVAEIAAKAFSGCASLTDVTVPDSVTRIDKKAFEGCTDFTIAAIAGSYAETWAKKNEVPYSEMSPAEMAAAQQGANEGPSSAPADGAPQQEQPVASTPENAPTPTPAVADEHISAFMETGPDGATNKYTFDDAKRLVSVESTVGNIFDVNFYYTADGKILDGIYDWDVAPYSLSCDAALAPQMLSYPTQDMRRYTSFAANGYPAQTVISVYGDDFKSNAHYTSFTVGGETVGALAFPYTYTYDEKNRVTVGTCTVTDTEWQDGIYTFNCMYGTPQPAKSLEEMNDALGLVQPDTYVTADQDSYSSIRFASAQSGLIVRSGPGQEYERKDSLEYLQGVCIRGYKSDNPDWCYVVYRNGDTGDSETFGWVSAEYLFDTEAMMNAYGG